ncbi:MAG: MerR family transcriptional regulator [Desulfovibrionales bacterium]|nr:MerR family transcriptional regulator [Desulfovibrionales bacterium]
MKFRLMAGEMAQLRNISKQTLIYYDRIGLFQPCEIDPETGYRYYSLEQFEELDIILCLKGLGLSLKEIKAYLKIDTTPDRIQALVDQHKILEKEIKRIHQAQNRLNAIINSHKNSLKITPFDMGITWRDEVPIISEPVPPPNDHYTLEVTFMKFFQQVQEEFHAEVQDILVFVDDFSHPHEKFLKLGLMRPKSTGESLPADHYAHIYHKGTFESLHESRAKLATHIKDLGYRATGPIITRLLLSTVVVSSRSEYLVELNVRVKKDQT